MKLSVNQLETSVLQADREGLFDRLTALYDTIRSGECAGCTQCCAESVNAFYIEFLAIWSRLQREPMLKARLMPRILRYYLLEMVERASCPFLDADGRCAVYEERPLVCRQFGHWSRKDFSRNIEAVLKANREAAEYYRTTHGLTLPGPVVEKTLQYCEAFEVAHKTGPMKRGEQTDTVFMLDVPFLQKGLLAEDLLGTPLVSWFVYTLYTPEEAGALRLQVMGEYLANGRSETLEAALTAAAAG